jgi:RHS repeat-associated protein
MCSASSNPSKVVGNPINFALGFKKQAEVDYDSGVLSFVRVYRSDSVWTDNQMGQRWRHSLARKLNVTATVAQVTDGTGAIAEFRLVGNTWVPKDSDVTAKFQTVAGGYLYTTSADTRELYDTAGRLLRINYRGSRALFLSYLGSNLTRVADENGRSLTLSYAGGSVSALTTPSGTYSYGYDASGNLISVTNPAGSVRRYHYEDARFPNAMTGITDERGIRFATYAYDTQGRAVLSKHAGDVNSYQVTYNVDGSITTTNPLGKRTTYQFQTTHGVRRIVAVQGHQSTNCAAANKAYTYDANGFLSSKTDWKGNVTSLTHDARGLLSTMTEGAGSPAARTTNYTYHPTFRVPTLIAEPGRTTSFTYDANGRLTSRTVTDTALSQSRTTTYTYYPNTVDSAGNSVLGQLHTVNGPRTDVVDVMTYQYTANGDLFKVINALGHTTEIRQRDAAGRPILTVDPNNVHTHFEYDTEGRIVKQTEGHNTAPNRGTTIYGYFNDGRLKSITKANGITLSYSYDPAGRLSSITNANSAMTYKRDAAGNPIETARRTLAKGAPATHRLFETYDELSQLLSSRNNTNRTSVGYDVNSNVISVSDALGRPTIYEYDALDRLRQVTNRLGGVEAYAKDSFDNLLSVTNPRSDTTGYTRNAFGDVLVEVSPDRGTTAYAYDAAGNRTRRTDARGVVTNYAYDALNRLTSVTYPADATQSVTLSYDAPAGCGYGKGRLCSIANANSARSFVYNALGDVIATTDARPGLTLAIGYTYDNAHYLTGITLPSGRQITYIYNLNGEVTRVTAGGVALVYSVTYLPFGPVARMTYGNGLSQVNTHDDAYRLTSRSVGSVLADIYAYDAKNNVSNRNGVPFSYDAIDRLTGQGADSYQYDPNGNRTSHTVGRAPLAFGYGGASGRVLSIGGRPVSYDGAGNITADAERAYSYDVQGRLREVRMGTNVAGTYAYDGAHQRVRKTAAGAVTHYVYGVDGRLYGEYAANGALQREYVYANGEPLAQISVGELLTYLHTDQLGTPRAGTNAGGASVWNWPSTAYGFGAPTGSITVNLRMAGQYFDAESGLFYNWHRYYDPQTGRYLTSDPTGLEGGLNTYGYAEANPAILVDPRGLEVTASVRLSPQFNTFSLDRLSVTLNDANPDSLYIGNVDVTASIDLLVSMICSESCTGAEWTQSYTTTIWASNSFQIPIPWCASVETLRTNSVSPQARAFAEAACVGWLLGDFAARAQGAYESIMAKLNAVAASPAGTAVISEAIERCKARLNKSKKN